MIQSHTPFPARIEGGGIVLALSPGELYLETVKRLSERDLNALLARHRLEPMDQPTGLFGRAFNHSFADRRWVTFREATPEALIAALHEEPAIRIASPVYHRPDLPFKTGLSFADAVLVKTDGQRTASRVTSDLPVALEIEQADGMLLRLTLPGFKAENALVAAARLSTIQGVRHAYPDWLSLTPSIVSTTPNDTLFPQEWDMAQIGAPQGWDLCQGNAGVVIAIIDTGCDLGHEDLAAKYVAPAQRRDIVTGTDTPNDDYGHGTCCASLAAAATGNALGATGVGWNCHIMPIRLLNAGHINSEADIVAAVNWAAGHGATVASMSWYWPGTTASADVAFAAAAAAGLTLVAASGNFDSSTIVYPATNPHVMAIGASDQADQRKNPGSPDGEGWGSNYGAQQSVIAPGVQCWAANNTNGGGSFNTNHGGPIDIAGKHYASSGTADGKYFALMNGTSAATPHVAGLAGLIRSAYPGLSADKVRTLIEQTAEKTGGYAYANSGAHANGAWHQEPGYGRISVFRALDHADVYIGAAPGDTGSRPYAGAFWDSSDIAIRQTDDGIFFHETAVAGQPNYVYVRVNNAGPAVARNVRVNARALAFLGTEFSYPADFTAVDALHLQPHGMLTQFPSLPVGATAIARFRLSTAQMNTIYAGAWHSCLVADVAADNDYNTGDGANVWLNNNLGQLNFSVQAGGGQAVQSLPFVIGNRANQDRFYDVMIDRAGLPPGSELVLDPSPAETVFRGIEPANWAEPECGELTFIDRTVLATRFCGEQGLLTLQAGSTFRCTARHGAGVTVKGGEMLGHRVAITAPMAVIGLAKAPGEQRAMSLSLRLAASTRPGTYRVVVQQRNTAGQTVGGVTFAIVKE